LKPAASGDATRDGHWQVRIVAPPPFLDLCEPLFDDAVAVSRLRQPDDGDAWALEALTVEEPAIAPLEAGLALLAKAQGVAAPAVEISFVEARDWLALNQAALTVFDVGPFRIVPTHHLASSHPDHRHHLVLDAGPAFGSGTHETTQACLLLMTWLANRVRLHRILDVGTGSGILAMAAARLWRCSIVATDIDPVAVATAQENATQNGLGPFIAFHAGAGIDPVRRGRPFDLAVANILSGPLAAMAGDIRRTVAPGGWLILSGILVSQENQVLCRYGAAGFRLCRRLVLGEWASFLLRRP